MAAIATGVTTAGEGLVVGGSFWQQAVMMSEPRTDADMRVRVCCSAIPSLWWAEAIAFHVGISVRWFRDTFCAAEVQEAQELGVPALQLLDQRADEVGVDARGVIPVFSDVMNYAAWKHAAPSFLNLPLEEDPRVVRASMYRALLNNAAIVTKRNLEIIESFSMKPLNRLVFAGGGSKSKLWTQIVSDVIGVKVKVPVVKEATAAGAGMCAAVGAGFFHDLVEAAGAWVSWDYQTEPQEDERAQYQEQENRWFKAYAPQRELMNNGVTTPMWAAPGA